MATDNEIPHPHEVKQAICAAATSLAYRAVKLEEQRDRLWVVCNDLVECFRYGDHGGGPRQTLDRAQAVLSEAKQE